MIPFDQSYPGSENDWRRLAACASKPTALFFPERPSPTDPAPMAQVEAALAVCRTCPVTAPCLQQALQLRELGIWGGTTDSDRRRIRAQLRRENRPVPVVKIPQPRVTREDTRDAPVLRDVCGTTAGFMRHYRSNERPCPACRASRTEQSKTYPRYTRR